MSDQGEEGAFARPYSKRDTKSQFDVPGQTGLTKRELIAAMALQGLLAHGEDISRYGVAAHLALRHADALLEALASAEVFS